MKPHAKPGWQLTEGQRVALEGAYLAVHRLVISEHEITEATPEFMKLLEAWDALKVPWDVRGKPHVIRCWTAPGSPPKFITEGVAETLAGVGRFLEEH